MAKENKGDLVIDEMARRLRLARGVIQRDYRGTKPLRMEPVSNDELIQRYDNMTQEQWLELMSTRSPEEIEAYRNNMENLKMRRDDYAQE